MEQNESQPQYWTISLTRFEEAREQSPIVELDDVCFSNLDEIERELRGFQHESKLAIGIAEFDDDDCNWGAFWLFLNTNRAWIHLMQGQCLTAHASNNNEPADDSVEFAMDNGEIRRVPLSHTVSREQGLAALRTWVATGTQMADLSWVRA